MVFDPLAVGVVPKLPVVKSKSPAIALSDITSTFESVQFANVLLGLWGKKQRYAAL